MDPYFKSYSSYKFDQLEKACDWAKMNLTGHCVRRLLQKSFWALGVIINFISDSFPFLCTWSGFKTHKTENSERGG